MCGRFVGRFDTAELIAEMLAVDPALQVETDPDAPARTANFNTAPTQGCLLFTSEPGTVTARTGLWGLVPPWAKDASGAARMINARSETITEKPSFRNLVPRHRAVVPMSGFYEWERSDPKVKKPFYVPRADGRTMWTAGLWTLSPALDGRVSFCIITRDSREDLATIHDRSPVQLTLDDALSWLCDESPPLGLLSLENPPLLAPYEVSRRVNSVRNNSADLLEPVEPESLF
ncbi:MAG: SOS response-associated peptidase [Acidimicrobiales bacterium]